MMDLKNAALEFLVLSSTTKIMKLRGNTPRQAASISLSMEGVPL